MDQRVTEPAPLLTATALSGHLEGLLGEIRIAQTYHNTEAVNIEAVFTFPVPTEAVLLGVEVCIDDRLLRGQVLPARQAEDDYEEAITQGDAAILLQTAGRGLYTVNIGNLLPGQTAELSYRYALLGVWDGDLWRLHLPTCLAPRYGDPLQGGLAPHQVPQVSLLAQHGFTLDLTLGGSLARAQVDSPSHRLAVTAGEHGQRGRLADGSAPLDRDLVLRIRAAGPERWGQALYAPDYLPGPSGGVALISLQPTFAAPAGAEGRDLVLVADASGSMAGDSIAQTRAALLAILDRLHPADRFNLIIFGSVAEALFRGQVPADEHGLAQARRAVAGLQADRGGTDIGAALRLAHRQRDRQPLDILLITDGEVWGVEDLIRDAHRARDRIFSIGVGAAVPEGLVRGLAEATGGACALVHPNEGMVEQIVRQFERMRAPRASLAPNWGVPPAWQWPATPERLFAGDTLHLFAGFADPPAGPVSLTLAGADGSLQTQSLELQPWPAAAGADTLPRLAAARRLTDLEEEQATALAVAYQLVTPHTHFLMRDLGADRLQADRLPELRQVPHQLAAGWGGLGAIAPSDRMPPSCNLVRDTSYLDAPAFLRQGAGPLPPPRGSFLAKAVQSVTRRFQAPDFERWLHDQARRLADPQEPVPNLTELAAAGLSEDLLDEINRLIAAGEDEAQVRVALLYALVLRLARQRSFPRETLRRLRFLVDREVTPALVERIEALVAPWYGPQP